MTVAPDTTIVERPWPFHTCPSCEGETFAVEAPEHAVVFCCLGCGDRWRFVLGYLHRVAPAAPAPMVPAVPKVAPKTLVAGAG